MIVHQARKDEAPAALNIVQRGEEVTVEPPLSIPGSETTAPA